MSTGCGAPAAPFAASTRNLIPHAVGIFFPSIAVELHFYDMKTLAITCLSALALQVAIRITQTEPNIVEEITICKSKRVAILADTTKITPPKDSLIYLQANLKK